jgi:drug/metabolite transporter (DMT)-like permease
MRWILVGVIVLCNSFGDILNTMGMKRHGEVEDLRPRHMLHLAWRLLRNHYVMAGMGCLALSFFALLGLLSIANVSFAVPATATGYLLETLLAKCLLKEDVHWRRWAGATLVGVGVLLISLY